MKPAPAIQDLDLDKIGCLDLPPLTMVPYSRIYGGIMLDTRLKFLIIPSTSLIGGGFVEIDYPDHFTSKHPLWPAVID